MSPVRLACATPDPRNIRTGRVIPDEGDCDQPHVVITDADNWLCVMTTGRGVEGEGGQHVVDGILNDGGPVRQFGWGRFDPELARVNGNTAIDIARSTRGDARRFRSYSRRLRTSAAVGDFRAGM